MDFSFFSNERIVFGWGKIENLGMLADEYGKRAFIVSVQQSILESKVFEMIFNELEKHNIHYTLYDKIVTEPEIDAVNRGIEKAKEFQADMVIGIGGGSIIDTAKAISGVITNGGSIGDYLEGIGKGSIIQQPPLPYIAVPTTAGTGAEATKNAVIGDKKHKVKRSLRSPFLIPKTALVDPELTVSLPRDGTAYSGMDAITQLIESYVSKKAQPIPEALCLYGIKNSTFSLEQAYQNGGDRRARENMSLAALLSGMALANSGLGAVHGLASSLGAAYNIPHGKLCAILLPYVIKINLNSAIIKYAHIGETLTGKNFKTHHEAAHAAAIFIEKLCNSVGIPSNLKEYHINTAELPKIVKNSRGSSMSGNPKDLTDDELMKLLESII